MLAAVSAGNAFLSRLYHSHLFLSKQEAGDCSENGFKLMTSYLKLASIAYGLELTRFKIIPETTYSVPFSGTFALSFFGAF